MPDHFDGLPDSENFTLLVAGYSQFSKIKEDLFIYLKDRVMEREKGGQRGGERQ